jgi:hypothetical protein
MLLTMSLASGAGDHLLANSLAWASIGVLIPLLFYGTEFPSS